MLLATRKSKIESFENILRLTMSNGDKFTALAQATEFLNSEFDGKLAGKEIVYTVTETGYLSGFTPVDEWKGPVIPEEGIVEVRDEA